jgi:hypothetical protein
MVIEQGDVQIHMGEKVGDSTSHVVCPHCNVPMAWFHSMMVRGQITTRLVSAFMCSNCNAVETRVSEIKP